MMELSEIRKFYPKQLHSRGAFLLREYLQYKILEIIFQSEYASKFAFLGGTCLRIVHNNQRFSEDLDFDNFDLNEQDFTAVSKHIQTKLEEQGYRVEMRNVFKGAYHCYIRFPGLLYQSGLSGHKEAKILINLDTEPQHFSFEPEVHLLTRFDLFTSIRVTPLDLLLSQKFLAITQRKRPKGRDFFDIMFLLNRTKPNYDFIELKLGISTEPQLREHLIKVCAKFNSKLLEEDVAPFLFNPSDGQRIQLFQEYLKTVPL